jgi:hypothetical protein
MQPCKIHRKRRELEESIASLSTLCYRIKCYEIKHKSSTMRRFGMQRLGGLGE